VLVSVAKLVHIDMHPVLYLDQRLMIILSVLRPKLSKFRGAFNTEHHRSLDHLGHTE